MKNMGYNKKIPLLSSLKKYSEMDIACFDVPGHVRSQGVSILNDYLGNEIMNMDINSSPIMDNVSNPNGIIKKAQELLANSYNAYKSFFMTNGTTQAIHVMILSMLSPGDKILLPRNVHKSVINGLVMSGATPIFIQPEFNYDLGISLNISFESVYKAIYDNKDIKCLFLLNPTYYGACTELEKIIKLCKYNNIKVLVDEAHGAHFQFHKELPPSSIELGADMASISIHKTGGALTQASALLINDTVDYKKILQTINMLQSTSASYLLMSSIDGARYNLDINGEKQLSNALILARYARNKLNRIDGVNVYSPEELKGKGVEFVDETKLCISVKGLNLTGFEVYDMLYKNFSVQVELGDLYNVLALISIGTSKKDVDRLIKAIEVIAKTKKRSKKMKDIEIRPINSKIAINPRDAFYAKKEAIDIKNSLNMICGESIMAYPPGIPIISPGEIITDEIINYINLLKDSGAYFTDAQDKKLNKILVVNDATSSR
ncbi:aminotransferase class I/II-fold pyridoxal phosphate-dependent enzyme [Romboutsia ilealis]|uniref:aminotransferase class I/II-fold pyridoxal phosphate-dependent enzyme n=1 Tax=Romboutsia ilealis TaxID=1115758 RepID=UPI0028972CF9|nr:aminotransferase class I/II-fold pyridoxal phosphate-dependent enzyme [Romboutsia ilealis]